MGLRCTKALVRVELIRDSLRRLLRCFGADLVTGRGVSGVGQNPSREDAGMVAAGFGTPKAWLIPAQAKGLG